MGKLLLKFYFISFIFFVIMIRVIVIESAYMVGVFGIIWIP